LALAFVAVVLAALAYPWQSDLDWWILGIAIAVIVIVFAWWRGLFVTTMIARRLSVFRRNHSKREVQPSGSVTVVLRIDDPAGVGLSLPMVAGYVERFGVRCEKVRVTNLDDGSASGTWISLTLNAVGNLTALRARSAELPLLDTAEIVGRRLADHLRETGLSAVLVDDAPKLLADGDRETWRGMRGDSGYLSAYAIPIDDGLRGRLAEVWTQPTETWSAVEFSGTSAHPEVRALCAFRTAEAVRGVPVAGLVPQRGIQRPLLSALAPRSTDRLAIPGVPLPPGLLEPGGWPVGGRSSVEHEVAHEAGHPA
jgi:type VII secretion protein EccE